MRLGDPVKTLQRSPANRDPMFQSVGPDGPEFGEGPTLAHIGDRPPLPLPSAAPFLQRRAVQLALAAQETLQSAPLAGGGLKEITVRATAAHQNRPYTGPATSNLAHYLLLRPPVVLASGPAHGRRMRADEGERRQQVDAVGDLEEPGIRSGVTGRAVLPDDFVGARVDDDDPVVEVVVAQHVAVRKRQGQGGLVQGVGSGWVITPDDLPGWVEGLD